MFSGQADWAIRVISVRKRRQDRTPSRLILSQTSAVTRILAIDHATWRLLASKARHEQASWRPLSKAKPVAFPSVRLHLHKHDPCCLDEQDAQVTVAAPRYLAEDDGVPGRYLSGNKLSQAAKSRPLQRG